MKILKQTLTLFALLAVFSTATFAQLTDNATVNASATVQAALSVNNVSDLSFGTILNSDTPTISATDASAGAVDIQNTSNGAGLDVSINFPSVLTDGTGTNSLDFGTYEAAYRLDGTNNATGATTFGTLSGQDITGSVTSTGNTIYVYVGGQITDATAGQSGTTYSNDITVTVDYQ